ncbi:MAG: DinB family protein [Lewinellaceae bacterium]|nr:DinB family protein [Lewinellaceae bacterium]
MKKLTTAVILFIFTQTLWSQNLWTEQDRAFLLKGLRNTGSELLAQIRELDEDQMSFKPDSNSWSIAEIVEHLGVYEEHLYWDLLYQQHSPERPELVEKVKGNDEALLAYATDPAKGTAPWLAEPIGRFEEKEALIRYFTRFRDEVISLIEGTDKDFRLHFIFREPTNSIWDIRDLHQYTLVWIAHTERHLNQLRRVKEHENYPK